MNFHRHGVVLFVIAIALLIFRLTLGVNIAPSITLLIFCLALPKFLLIVCLVLLYRQRSEKALQAYKSRVLLVTNAIIYIGIILSYLSHIS